MSEINKRMTRLALLPVMVLVVLALAVAPALAADGFGIVPGSFTATITSDQAGAHADANTSFTFNTDAGGTPLDSAKDIIVDLPPGIVGNPQSFPTCTAGQLVTQPNPICPVDSQVGQVNLSFIMSGSPFEMILPVYNMAPRASHTAEFGFNAIMASIFVTVSVRPEDHGLRATIANIPTTLRLVGSSTTLWGNPADPVHDERRGSTSCLVLGGVPYCSRPPTPSGLEPAAFMRSPTECGKPGVTTLTVDSWQHPDEKVTVASAPTTMVGCDRLRFDADLTLQPNEQAAGQPTGATVDLTVPQSENPNDLGTADLKKAVVTLPAGMTVSPASADGLQGCSPAQIGLDDSDDPTCPQTSKIGTVQIDTPLLGAPMTGGVYLARPHDNPFDSLLALYVVAQGSGVTIKLPGKVAADPQTGQLTTTFDDNPQMPFTRLRLKLNAGPQAPLSLPRACGTYVTRAELTSWGGHVVQASSPMTVDRNCEAAGRFRPSLTAGSVNPVAGAFSPFSLTVARQDGDKELKAIRSVRMPEGLLGLVASVPLCGEAQAGTGTCAEASRVGHVQVAAGAGTAPLWMPQAGKASTGVYLTGPYRGAPFGLSIKVPAQAGPFDLGTVVVRSALRIDPKTAAITAETDDLPTILEGIPLNVREVRLILDRSGFMFNPTSCAPKQISATVESGDGVAQQVASRFQVGDCAAKPFSPIIAVSGGGKGQTARFRHPALKVTVRQSPAQAHLDKTDVVLPKAFNVDLQAPALKAACPREVYAQDRCSKTAIVGTVKAVTPVFAEPLTGAAFLLQKKGELPDIAMRLSNVHYSIDLIGVLDFLQDGRVITRVKNIPDAPITSFELNIKGGKGGSLLTRNDLCTKKAATQATFKGQNGKVVVKQPTTRIVGCPKRASGGHS